MMGKGDTSMLYLKRVRKQLQIPGAGSQAGASLVGIMVALAITAIIGIVISQSWLNRARLKSRLTQARTYGEIDEAFRLAVVNQASAAIRVAGSGCARPRDMFRKVDVLPGLMFMEYTTDFTTRAITAKNPANLALGKHRCKTRAPEYPTDARASSQNRYYFCVELQLANSAARKSLGDGAPLKMTTPSSVGEGAYAEIVLELQNGHSFRPVSCRDFQNSSSHGMKVHYSLHWLAPDAGQKDKYDWRRKNGVFYNQKTTAP